MIRMFPGIDGFHWTIGHIVFLTLFFAVVVTIAATVSRAVWRTARDFRGHRAIDLCWKVDFAELPEADRRCRHELAGRVISRTCDNQFDCRHCENYPRFSVLPATGLTHDLGLDYPDDRLYHRGHTWVKAEADGTVVIGLDALAEHLIGKPDFVEPVGIGEELEVNQTAWRIRKNGHDIRARAPLEGTIISMGNRDDGWCLKMRPRLDVKDPKSLRHLLHGPEVHGWVSREMERLQLQLRPPGTHATLADGGELVYGLMDALPESDWNAVLADTFLEV
jgi:glycine cleavage system H lipoate-binding protein